MTRIYLQDVTGAPVKHMVAGRGPRVLNDLLVHENEGLEDLYDAGLLTRSDYFAYLHGEGKDDFNLPLEEHNRMHKPEVRKALLKEGKLKIKPGQTEEEALEVTHTAVYGRLDPDGPAGTITTGFMTPGRGRYVHPTQKRTINPHEAARIQGFPDDYRFTLDGKPPTTQLLTKWIGDAVPMPLGYAAALSVLGPDLSA